MTTSALSKVNFNPFEQAFSSDMNRVQIVAARETLNRLLAESRAPDSGDASVAATTNSVEQNVRTQPLAGFDLSLDANQAYVDDSTGATADESTYQVLRWGDTQLVIGTPNVSPRIDLVVGALAQEQVDLQLRNLLVDPANRTVVQNLVSKTGNPSATITVLAGTPGVNPIPPTPGVGQYAICEVLVMASATGSGDLEVTPRMWRRNISVEAALHGAVQGCRLTWGNNTGGEASNHYPFVSGGVNKVAIDGELLSHYQASVYSHIENDVLANPFASAAPATNDVPFYVYLVGGRNSPQGPVNVGNHSGPWVTVYSLTPPDAWGRPSSAIQTLRGVTQRGAVYIGVGFKIMNTTFSKCCGLEGDMIWARSGQLEIGIGGATHMVGFNEADPTLVPYPTAPNTHTFATRPAPSTFARIKLHAYQSTGTQTLRVYDEDTSTNEYARLALVATGLGLTSVEFGYSFFVNAAPELNIECASAVANTYANIFPLAWNMNVPRLSP